MSGGHYDYIYHKEAADFAGRAASLVTLGEIAADFDELGFPELKVDTMKAIVELSRLAQACDALDVSLRDLRECWKMLDLFKSGDTGREDLDEWVERYIRVKHGGSNETH